jgi:hypothetical protein
VALKLARLHASLADAEERLDRLLVEPGATAVERLEGAVAVRTLRDELADAAREQGPAVPEPAVPALTERLDAWSLCRTSPGRVPN